MEKNKKPNQEIEIPLSEEDCHEILRGETFDWTFDGIDTHLFLED